MPKRYRNCRPRITVQLGERTTAGRSVAPPRCTANAGRALGRAWRLPGFCVRLHGPTRRPVDEDPERGGMVRIPECRWGSRHGPRLGGQRQVSDRRLVAGPEGPLRLARRRRGSSRAGCDRSVELHGQSRSKDHQHPLATCLLLEYLTSRAGQVVHLPTLCRILYRDQVSNESSTIRVVAHSARALLGPHACHLRTVRGMGYAWVPDAHTRTGSPGVGGDE